MSLTVFPVFWMSYRHYAQQPTRFILKPARSSHTTGSPPTASTLPVVEIRDPPVPTQAAQRAVRNLPKIPLKGPIPSISLPETQNREQLVELLIQLVSQLESDAEEAERNEVDRERVKISRPQAGRPTYQAEEFPEFRQILMGPWVPGPCYGPVYKPSVAMTLPSTPQLHRYLSPPSGTKGHLRWNVTEPVSSAAFIEDGQTLGFEDFRMEPATSPRLTTLQIISSAIPWSSSTTARKDAVGVTIGEFLSSMSVMLTVAMTEDRIARLSSEADRTAILREYKERCPNETDIPRVYDLLSGCTTFGGLTYDPELEKKQDFPDSNWKIHIFAHYLRGSID